MIEDNISSVLEALAIEDCRLIDSKGWANNAQEYGHVLYSYDDLVL